MSRLTRGQALTLAAMERELKILTKRAEKAKKAMDLCQAAPGELLAVYKEAKAIDYKNMQPKAMLGKSDELRQREERAKKLMNQDYLMLIDRRNETKLDVSELEYEINMLKLKASL